MTGIILPPTKLRLKILTLGKIYEQEKIGIKMINFFIL